MNYSTSVASKASSGTSATFNALVAEATFALFVVGVLIAGSVAFYDVSTPPTFFVPMIVYAVALYVYAAAIKIYTCFVALMSWAGFKFVWFVFDIAKVIDKAFWSILSVEESHTVTDATTEQSVKSVNNVKPTTKRVRWNPTNEIQYIKPASEMTREEKDAWGYNADFLTKFRLKNAPEPMTPDAPQKVSRGPRLVIALPVALFSDELVEEEEDCLYDEENKLSVAATSSIPEDSTKTVKWKCEEELVEVTFIKSRREMSADEKADLWYPLDIAEKDDSVEDHTTVPFTTDDEDDDDDCDSIGTLSDLDLWEIDILGGTNGSSNDTSSPTMDVSVIDEAVSSDVMASSVDDSTVTNEGIGDSIDGEAEDGDRIGDSIDGEAEEEEQGEEEPSESDVDAVVFTNDDLAADEEESGGSDDDETELELVVREDFKTFNLFQKFDAIEDEAKHGNGVTSFGSRMVNVNGRDLRRSRRNR